ncbi:DUF4232 domain-containing protein [Kitasatospora camelliae]|uniref:DUF4232 domain-containing protein n=1 Tax=Kitasatospora camelliae TaxID=3156397 RepID=A0AAU8K075_9ACTN
MFAARTSRTRLITAAATAALALCTLTACDDGAATAAGPASPSGAAPTGAVAGSPAAAPASNAPTAHAAPTAAAKTAAPTRTPAAPDKQVPCEGSNTKTTAAPLNRPVNHMLLTVTNTGTGSCNLYGYPAVRFGEAQAVPPVIEDSHPQAVVTLRPGESGYASVNLAAADGSAAHGHTVTSLTVYFHGPSGNQSVGTGARPALPATGVHVDDSLKVTYWQRSLDEATSW